MTISTALTFDRNGTCIEGHGIPVDVETPLFEQDGREPAMEAAMGVPE